MGHRPRASVEELTAMAALAVNPERLPFRSGTKGAVRVGFGAMDDRPKPKPIGRRKREPGAVFIVIVIVLMLLAGLFTRIQPGGFGVFFGGLLPN